MSAPPAPPPLRFAGVFDDPRAAPLPARSVPLVCARLSAPALAARALAALHAAPLPRELAHVKRVRSTPARIAGVASLASGCGPDAASAAALHDAVAATAASPAAVAAASLTAAAAVDVLVGTPAAFAAWQAGAGAAHVAPGVLAAAAVAADDLCRRRGWAWPAPPPPSPARGPHPFAVLAPLAASFAVVDVAAVQARDAPAFAWECAHVWPMARVQPGRGGGGGAPPPPPPVSPADAAYFSAALGVADALAARGAARGHPRRACVIASPPPAAAACARRGSGSGGFAEGGDGSGGGGPATFVVRGAAWDASAVRAGAAADGTWVATHPLRTAALLAVDDVAEADRAREAAAAVAAAAATTAGADSGASPQRRLDCVPPASAAAASERPPSPCHRVFALEQHGVPPALVRPRDADADADAAADAGASDRSCPCRKRRRTDGGSAVPAGVTVSGDGVQHACAAAPPSPPPRGYLGRAWLARAPAKRLATQQQGVVAQLPPHPPPPEPAAAAGGGSGGGSYLCTGYDAFLTHEPGPLDAMALLHSRVARVVFRTPDARGGALGSVAALHELRGVNHHYRVYRVVAEAGDAGGGGGGGSAAGGGGDSNGSSAAAALPA